MVKVFNPPSFNVKLAFKPKRNNNSIKNSIISRKCFAVVKLIEGEFKAVINIDKKQKRQIFAENNIAAVKKEYL